VSPSRLGNKNSHTSPYCLKNIAYVKFQLVKHCLWFAVMVNQPSC